MIVEIRPLTLDYQLSLSCKITDCRSSHDGPTQGMLLIWMYCIILLLFWRLQRFTENHARVSETGNENISSSNRPSTLEGKYEQFYDLERMDAIDCIEGSRIEKEQSRWAEVNDQYIACLIFEVNILKMAHYT